jgi:hypothetical protein
MEFLTCSVITNPRMGCSGKFANSDVKFLENPDTDENEWLTSDDDLKRMSHSN